MQQHTFLVALALIPIAIQSSAGIELTLEEKKECLKLSKRTLKTMLKNFNTCTDKLNLRGVPGEEFQKKIGCIVKCVMQSADALDANGLLTMETLRSQIATRVPEGYVDYAEGVLAKCINEHTLDPKDENCKSYLDMGTCMQGAFAEMCGGEPSF